MVKSRNCLLLAVLAATALLGWRGGAEAALVHYSIPQSLFASATFKDIVNPPPNGPVSEIFFGSFDVDAAKETLSNVVLSLFGLLYPGTYTFSAPNVVLNDSLVTALDANHQTQVFIYFQDPLDGAAPLDLMTKMTIVSNSGGPCPFPGCSTETVSGAAFRVLSSPTPVPEPTSLAIFGSASVVWMVIGWANRRRAGQRSSGPA